MCTLGQETDSLAPHNPHNSATSGLQLFSHSLSLWILVVFFQACAATDSASHEPGTITLFPRNTTNSLKGVFRLLKPFCQFKRHKRLHTLASSLYKSSAEEDSRRTGVLKPNLKGVIYNVKNEHLCVCPFITAHIFQNRDGSSDSNSHLASR